MSPNFNFYDLNIFIDDSVKCDQQTSIVKFDIFQSFPKSYYRNRTEL